MLEKFNLKIPDGNAYYGHEMRTDEGMFSKHKHGGGNVVIWGCFSLYGRTLHEFLDGRQNSSCYIDLIEEVMFPKAHKFLDSRVRMDLSTRQRRNPLFNIIDEMV